MLVLLCVSCLWPQFHLVFYFCVVRINGKANHFLDKCWAIRYIFLIILAAFPISFALAKPYFVSEIGKNEIYLLGTSNHFHATSLTNFTYHRKWIAQISSKEKKRDRERESTMHSAFISIPLGSWFFVAESEESESIVNVKLWHR